MSAEDDKEAKDRLIHDIGNAINTIALRLEVAKMHLEAGEHAATADDIELLQQECKAAARIIHGRGQ